MPTNQEVFTKEELSEAYMFLNSIRLNLALRARWQAYLASVKNDKTTFEQKIQKLDDFLTKNGFNVNVKAVFYILKTPWWNDYIASIKSTKVSDEFVQKLLQDPKLFLLWSQSVAKNPLKADQLLKDLGFNCNIQQVSASFIKMRHQNITFWTAVYGKVSMTDKDGKKMDKAPTLVIYKGKISIGPDVIFGWTYENGTLTWPLKSDKMSFANKCSGSVTFSDIIHPSKKGGYTGKIFSGILNYSDDPKSTGKIYTYEGRVGDPNPKNKTPSKLEVAHQNLLKVHGVVEWIFFITCSALILVATVVPFALFFGPLDPTENSDLKSLKENADLFGEKFKTGDNPLGGVQIKTSQEIELDTLKLEKKQTPSPENRKKIEVDINKLETQIASDQVQANKNERDDLEVFKDNVKNIEIV